MKSNYYIDLRTKSIEWLKKYLETSKLLPSQQVLKEKTDERFDILTQSGIKNLHDLQQTLKNKDKVQHFSVQTGLPVDYLTILRREVNSYHPQPRKISDFPFIKSEVKEKLQTIGIKDTIQLFSRVATRQEREKLIQELSITRDEALILVKAVDLMRIRYVNHTFANLLLHSNYDTISKIQKADYNKLYKELYTLNANQNYFTGNFGASDMELFVSNARFFGSAVEL
ncbi:MAG TPA: DUF4332 domain-containing protein [Chryseobacterium sp.]|nr:DUF4332 domain-containing protein [Chryseobacterium sp.]